MVRPSVIVQRVLLILVSVCLSVVVLEAGFRVAHWHRLTQPDNEDHPVYHHRLKPNWRYPQGSPDFHTLATTNSLALRGPREYGPKPPGVRRVLMLGDSFTFGVGVNDGETFCDLVQRRLDQRQAGVEIINAGLGSYSPLLHYLALRDLYLPLDPDAVVLWFDFGDLQNDFWYERNVRRGPGGEPAACDPNYTDGRFDRGRYLREHFALAKYINNKLFRTIQKAQILGWRRYLLIALRGGSAKAAIANLKGQERRHTDPLHYDQLLMIRDRAYLPEIERHWQRTGGYILMIRDLLKARGVPLVLAAYPYGVQVGPDQWGKGRTAFGFEPGITYDDPFPFELMAGFAREHGIPFLTTAPAFAAARQEPLFYDWDGHFTPRGHQVIADALERDPVFLNLLKHLE